MTLFRPEALEHKRRKLHGEVIIVQPVSFFVLTAIFFVLTVVMVGFLASGEYKRKETVIGYIAPERGLSVIRAEAGHGRYKVNWRLFGRYGCCHSK